MGDQLKEIVDVTISYPANDTRKLFGKLLSGQIPAIQVSIRCLPVPETVNGRDYLNDSEYQAQMQSWVNQLWQDKDAQLQVMKQGSANQA